MDQHRKIDSKGEMQISGLDRKKTNKIARTLERRVKSQESRREVDLQIDSDPETDGRFSDKSMGSGDSISIEPYLALSDLCSGT